MLQKKKSLFKLSHLNLLALAFIFLLNACSDDDDTMINGDDNGDNDTAEVIDFEDDELEVIIRETLDLSSSADITQEVLLGLTELNLTNSVVTNLSGLEFATNLEVLLARNVEIEDMSPLAELENIIEIDMRDASLPGPDHLSFMADWNNIERIDFQNVRLSDISVLEGKTSLTHINLRETDVTDISALTGMTQLLFLNLNRAGGGDGVTNPEITIPMDKLYYLSLRNTTLGDELFAQIFENKDQMVETNIRNTGITTVAPLVPLFEAGAFSVELSELYGNKRSLDLQNNEITDLCLIEPYQDLFDENNELEWSPVAGDLDNCNGEDQEPEIGDHDFIEDEALLMAILTTLNLDSYQDLTEESILDLVELNIRGTEVTSLAGLEKALNLEDFNARDTEIADISALAGMENLVSLNLRQTLVRDISALEGMTQLQYLNLNRAGGGDGITNPELLAPMVNLYYLNLRNTQITDEQFEMFENFDQLVECNVRNSGITSIAPLAAAFEKGAFTEELSEQYGNSLSLDLQQNDITDLCLISEYVDVFPEGELETEGDFDFDSCED